MKLNLNNYEMEHEKEVKVRGLFINRELSLLQFDRRVLYYATDKARQDTECSLNVPSV